MNGPAGFLLGFWIALSVQIYVDHLEEMEALQQTTPSCTITPTNGD